VVKQKVISEKQRIEIALLAAQFNQPFGRDSTMVVGFLLFLIFLALIAPGLLRGLFLFGAWIIGMMVLFMWVGSL